VLDKYTLGSFSRELVINLSGLEQLMNKETVITVAAIAPLLAGTFTIVYCGLKNMNIKNDGMPEIILKTEKFEEKPALMPAEYQEAEAQKEANIINLNMYKIYRNTVVATVSAVALAYKLIKYNLMRRGKRAV